MPNQNAIYCLFCLRVCLRHKVHITLVIRTQGHTNAYTQRFTV